MDTKLIEVAWARRQPLLERLHAEDTDTYRLFHGVAEGCPGMSVDRYGPVLLVQTWREPLEPGTLEQIANAIPLDLHAVWNHRKGGGSTGTVPTDVIGREYGMRFDARPRHRGQDPLLFLDFRCSRRWVRNHAEGRSVLNLFSYTCGMGVMAAMGGASRVLNVDFASSALAVGRKNAELNGVAMDTLEEDVHPIIRQLAGLSVGGRRGRVPRYKRVAQERFDLVVLDPPRWAKTAWGAVDVVRDYASLFKPAWLATADGGTLLATNHVPSVDLDVWLSQLRRSADKAGRPIQDIEMIEPEEDVPSFDGRHPLKIALCRS